MASTGPTTRTTATAPRGPALTTLAAVGLVALGVVHVVVGWLGLSIAWGGDPSAEPSPTGAFAAVAEQPLGAALLWVCAVGLLGLAAGQVAELGWGARGLTGLDGLGARVRSGGRAVGYLVLAGLALRTATGARSAGDEEQAGTARLLGVPGGELLVGAVGSLICLIAVHLLHRGVTKRFLAEFTLLGASLPLGSGRSAVVRLGQVGHVAKAVAYGIVGTLVITAAVRHDPAESGGLDEALATLREQPYGPVLLTAVAAGLVAYGVYAFALAWAARPRQRAA